MQAILVINAGSSSIKFSVFNPGADEDLTLVAHGQVEGIGTNHTRLRLAEPAAERSTESDLRAVADHRAAMAVVQSEVASLSGGKSVAGAGHRVVHGGVRYARPIRVDDAVLRDLDALVPLAPLHQPHNLAAIRALAEVAPELPQVACFDTAFHRGHPLVADLFALPYEFYDEGVRRYGFHGLSYEYIAGVLPRLAPGIAGGRVVVAHLGNGASLCALKDGPASIRRWDSPRSTDCRWERVPERSTPGCCFTSCRRAPCRWRKYRRCYTGNRDCSGCPD